MLITINQPDDPRIAPFMNVRDRDLNDGHGGRFVAEGESVLNVLMAQRRYQVEALLVAENRVETVEALAPADDLPVYVAAQQVMDAIVGFPIHRGLLGVGWRGNLPTASALLASAPPLVVGLVGIANHDNMGGIFRNAAAFGAGAVVLDASEEPGIISTHLHADGSYGELLTLPNADRVNPDNSIYLTMAGNEVFKVAVTELAHIVDETLEANNLERTALDWLVPHQANLRIISATAKKLGMSMDNVVVTLDRHGNTSAASVPCAFDEAVRDGRIKRGQLVLLEAFGGGFTWGSALVRF